MTTYAEARAIISNAITILEKAEDSASDEEIILLLDLADLLRQERRRLDIVRLADDAGVYVDAKGALASAADKLKRLSAETRRKIKAAEHTAQAVGALAKLVELTADLVL